MPAIGRMDMGDNTHGDFDRARREASARRFFALFRRSPGLNRLLSFEEAEVASGTRTPTYVGLRAVETGRIVGSVGRHGDFDRAFMPASPAVGERWRRVNRAFRRAERLPPVKLNKVGDAYFVLDGNHRVSVARFHGVEWIDAEVIEFRKTREEIPCR